MVIGLMMIAMVYFASTTLKPSSSQNLASAARDLANYLTLARAEAVRHQTVVRLVFPKRWPGIEDPESYRRMALFRWDPSLEEFVKMGGWAKIPEGVVLEPDYPNYCLNSGYANHDGATTRGDYLLQHQGEPFEITINRKSTQTRFVEFLPTGGARIPEGLEKRILLVAVEGFENPPQSGNIVRTVTGGDRPKNWAQVNIETLTGKVRVYRP
ncbi:MAG: GspH/FimT family pseudopilin [Verrucomicrobiota bacterium]